MKLRSALKIMVAMAEGRNVHSVYQHQCAIRRVMRLSLDRRGKLWGALKVRQDRAQAVAS